MNAKGDLTIEPELLAIPAFKKIIDKDKSKDKDEAMKVFSYIYFMYSMKSDFQFHTNEEERHGEICSFLKLKNFKVDGDVGEAIKIYQSLSRTVSSELLKSALIAIDKLSQYVRNVDLTEEDKNGKLKHDANKLKDLIKSIPDLHNSLKTTEEAILKEKEDGKKFVGSKKKNTFEDDDEL